MRPAHRARGLGARWRPPEQGVLRLGLDDPRCLDQKLVGNQVAVLAAAAGRTPVPETVVLSVPVGTSGGPPWGPGAVPATRWGALTGCPVSIRSWLVRPDRPDQVVEPVWNNIDPAGLTEAVAEITAAARRRGAGDAARQRLVLAVQHFRPAAATALVLVEARHRVDVRLCWGLAEPLGTPLHFDRFSFAGEPLHLEGCAIADKYTATVAASGGTHSVRVPPGLVAAPVLALVEVTELAARSRRLARVGAAPVELEFALVGTQRLLLAVRAPATRGLLEDGSNATGRPSHGPLPPSTA
ncbi:hypothetical protein [Saccharothrix coeruleofusca]|uniref:Pyruvate phosphate dikinase AMP/ATP-binding domain-containing protein n=1 Tax=Saccharothrix coeruleofusca TaxID=33919 RepID=A0A918ANT0_9PSEU|nr:hypothetical protein [Saccharothrix coeruleofusca]GGP66370.1 hypothetical protein GCM10010185_43800 [Saccharothrix coeruleofusca]